MFPIGMLLAVWIAWGAMLGLIAATAWLRAAQVQGWIADLQRSYGLGMEPGLLLRSDVHIHAFVALMAVLWLGLGCRMFAPRTLPWLPLVLLVPIAISDEIAQIGSPDRNFDWGDQIGDATGMILAIPLLLLLRRLPVGPTGRQPVRPPPSSAHNQD